MKTVLFRLTTSFALTASGAVLLALVSVTHDAPAADRTWNGGGSDNNWSTPANWGGTAPTAGDALSFGGSVRTSPFNDFPAGTLVAGLSVNNPAGPFTLGGNGLTLGGDIVDDMPLVPQAFQVALTLNANRGVSVVADGLLTLGGVISGNGFGLAKAGAGQLVLSGANTFNGAVAINAGTLTVSSDGNLGAAPAAPAAGRISINGAALRSTASFTLNANRGITLGPDGDGTISVVQNSRINMGNYTAAPYTGASTVTYGGTVAGSGGLVKNGFGGLTLAAANTYSGPTVVKVGTLRLDFSAAGAPANDIIPSGSSLTLGGENAVFSGAGAQSFAALVLTGRDSANNAQAFSSTTNDLGQTYLRLNSGQNGGVNLRLGALHHKTGGGVIFVLPGNGAIHTTSANDASGIIGGWATLSTNATPIQNGTIIMSQALATVDPNGAIGPYTGYTTYTTEDDAAGVNLNSAPFVGRNIVVVGGANHAATTVQVDTPGAGTTTDVNTISFSGMRNDQGNTAVPSDGVFIGEGNTLRLGRFGAIYRQDAALGVGNVQINVFVGGPADAPQQGQGTPGAQNVGTLTAGGAENTPGEIVLHVNNHNQTTGRMNVQARIADNGTAPVSVIKTGPGGLKINGHNTYSGGTYVIQGLIQLTGSEAGGTANPDGLGTGPVYIFNGGRVSLALGNNPQDYYIAGVGTDQENFGALIGQNGSVLTGKLTLIGDARVARSGDAAGVSLAGQITDEGKGFSLELGNGGNSNNLTLTNNTPNPNIWSGNTIIGRGRVNLGASEQIPDGLGKGNAVLNSDGGAANNSILNLNGYDETINGLTTAGNAANANIFIENQAASTTSTLTAGRNDQSTTFRGVLRDNGGVLALTKTGGGRLTLTGANSYSGNTVVNAGTLAVSGSGSIATSQQILVDGGTLDVSEVTGGFTHAFPVDINNGALVVRSTVAPGIALLTLADSTVRVASLGSTPIAVETTSLGTGGQANRIDIASVGAISGYPAQFTIIKYTGAIGGAGFNFELGGVPTSSTVGFVSNNVDNSSVDVVLLDGPKTLTWTGAAGPAWDTNQTVNWLAFGVTPSVFLDVDSVRFDDTASASTVSLSTALQPGSVLVNNATLNYTFTGPGRISGPGGLTKEGPGTLILDNTGTNDFFGPLTINGGTVQVGNGNARGSLGAGNVVNEGSLTFARSDPITVPNIISGAGTLVQSSPVLTLSGENVFTGPVVLAQGTLRPGSGSALGTGEAGTTVNDGTSLDVNGQNLTAEPITVAGTGVGGQGAIVNSGAPQINALRTVTLAGDTTFGGTERWDIRNAGGAALLSSGGAAYHLTKNGPNQVSLVGVGVDAALGDITIRQGLLGWETSTSTMGDPAKTLTVESGASLGFFDSTALWNKQFVLQNNGAVTNLSGSNTMAGPVTLNGNGIFGVSGAALVCSGAITGPGNLRKLGAGTLVLASLCDYAGSTTVSNGTLFIDGFYQGTGEIGVYGGTLGGAGVIGAPVIIGANGNLAPGNFGSPLAFIQLGGSLTLGGTCTIDLNKSAAPLIHDLIVFATDLTFGGTLRLNNSGPALAAGDAFPIFGFTSASGAFSRIEPPTPGPGLVWDTSTLTIDGTLRVVAPARPGIATISIADSNLFLTGTNGTPGGISYVLSSTNVALPLADWARVGTNVFDGAGRFNFSQPVDPNIPQRFFLLQLP